MITVTDSGSFDKTVAFLQKLERNDMFRNIDALVRRGVDALAAATPSETGETANSWEYEIIRRRNGLTIYWTNTHIDEGVGIALILQYGHGTGTGGYVQGRDYINPAMRPIFDQILREVWRQVTNG